MPVTRSQIGLNDLNQAGLKVIVYIFPSNVLQEVVQEEITRKPGDFFGKIVFTHIHNQQSERLFSLELFHTKPR